MINNFNTNKQKASNKNIFRKERSLNNKIISITYTYVRVAVLHFYH